MEILSRIAQRSQEISRDIYSCVLGQTLLAGATTLLDALSEPNSEHKCSDPPANPAHRDRHHVASSILDLQKETVPEKQEPEMKLYSTSELIMGQDCVIVSRRLISLERLLITTIGEISASQISIKLKCGRT